jgi:hypothetical protein
MPVAIQVKFDTTALSRVDRKLKAFQGPELAKRGGKLLRSALRPLPPAMRTQMSSAGIKRRSGKLSRSVKITRPRKRYGEVAAYTVGPTARHRHLVIQGHRIVTPGGRDTGRYSRNFDVIQPVADRYTDDVLRTLSHVWDD